MAGAYTGTGLKSLRTWVNPSKRDQFVTLAKSRGHGTQEALEVAMNLYMSAEVPVGPEAQARLAHEDPERFKQLIRLGFIAGGPRHRKTATR